MNLIIIISATHSGKWGKLLPTSINTMAMQKHDNVKIYYMLPLGNRNFDGLLYYSGVEDNYNYQHMKAKNIIEDIWNEEWDFILFGSQSSYFDFNLCYQKMLTLPKVKCYCGIDGGQFASGSGFFISRDVAEIIKNNMPNVAIVESDVYVAEILLKHKIKITPGAERVQYNFQTHKIDECYHIRCKTDTEEEKMREAEAFNNIFTRKCFH